MTSLTTNSPGTTPNTNQYTDSDQAEAIGVYTQPTTLVELQNSMFKNEFKQKEDKYFANLINISSSTPGEVIYGQSISGVKGFLLQLTWKRQTQLHQEQMNYSL